VRMYRVDVRIETTAIVFAEDDADFRTKVMERDFDFDRNGIDPEQATAIDLWTVEDCDTGDDDVATALPQNTWLAINEVMTCQV
jgi:hypothetical protein